MGKIIAQAIIDKICEILKYNRIDHFVGGSYRFGFYNQDSDIDIIILADKPGDVTIQKLETILDEKLKPVCTLSAYPNQTVSGSFGHIVIHQSKNSFERERETHNRIEQMLKENPGIVEFIKYLRRMTPSDTYKGADIYRILMMMSLT